MDIEITTHPYGILKGVVDSNAFVRGTWGCAIADAITPAPDDIVIEGKRGLDTVANTNLGFILWSRGMQTLAGASFLANYCENRRRASPKSGDSR